FESEAFQWGGSAEGFEPETRETWTAADQVRTRQFRESLVSESTKAFAPNSSEGSTVIHLTIIGSPSATPPPTQPTSDLSPWSGDPPGAFRRHGHSTRCLSAVGLLHRCIRRGGRWAHTRYVRGVTDWGGHVHHPDLGAPRPPGSAAPYCAQLQQSHREWPHR